jgi:hypothetical protein
LPWSAFWERNYFGEISPVVRAFVTNNFVRGGISGLGVVNLLAGLSELVVLFAVRETHDVGLGLANPAETSYPTGPDTQVDR